ncbi:MAG: DUF4184 family protein [Nitrososphaerota archaeon]|nr:metal-dependent hydrolase [Candidatus Bathyarchaeota archaeon]MDW8049080.1 DUF4184 family protein [Nitrososphaerota archaeon]
MPSPLGHYTLAYLIHRVERRLSLPALLIGSVLPDLDIILAILTDGLWMRGLFHSIIGGGMIVAFLSIPVTVHLYPLIASLFVRMRREDLRRECGSARVIFASSLLGGLSHVLVDSTCHNYNPLFYPIVKESVDFLLLPYDWDVSYAMVEATLLTTFLIIIAFNLRREDCKGFWRRMLLG